MIFTCRVINIVTLMKSTTILRATHIARTERENTHSQSGMADFESGQLEVRRHGRWVVRAHEREISLSSDLKIMGFCTAGLNVLSSSTKKFNFSFQLSGRGLSLARSMLSLPVCCTDNVLCSCNISCYMAIYYDSLLCNHPNPMN
jgi:hypothetical protein